MTDCGVFGGKRPGVEDVCFEDVDRLRDLLDRLDSEEEVSSESTEDVLELLPVLSSCLELQLESDVPECDVFESELPECELPETELPESEESSEGSEGTSLDPVSLTLDAGRLSPCFLSMETLCERTVFAL